MKRLTKEDWGLWNVERKRFLLRDTEGITKDLEALKAHILKLQEVCPKDKAGWPVGIAFKVLDELRRDFNRFTGYLKQFR